VMALHDIIPPGDLAHFHNQEEPEEVWAEGEDSSESGEVDAVAILELAIRSRWNLWEESPLVRYFHRKGVLHPDHMSGIVLQAWMDAIQGRDVDEDVYFRHFPT